MIIKFYVEMVKRLGAEFQLTMVQCRAPINDLSTGETSLDPMIIGRCFTMLRA